MHTAPQTKHYEYNIKYQHHLTPHFTGYELHINHPKRKNMCLTELSEFLCYHKFTRKSKPIDIDSISLTCRKITNHDIVTISKLCWHQTSILNLTLVNTKISDIGFYAIMHLLLKNSLMDISIMAFSIGQINISSKALLKMLPRIRNSLSLHNITLVIPDDVESGFEDAFEYNTNLSSIGYYNHNTALTTSLRSQKADNLFSLFKTLDHKSLLKTRFLHHELLYLCSRIRFRKNVVGAEYGNFKTKFLQFIETQCTRALNSKIALVSKEFYTQYSASSLITQYSLAEKFFEIDCYQQHWKKSGYFKRDTVHGASVEKLCKTRFEIHELEYLLRLSDVARWSKNFKCYVQTMFERAIKAKYALVSKTGILAPFYNIPTDLHPAIQSNINHLNFSMPEQFVEISLYQNGF